MKIAFITYEYPPFVYGGAGTYAREIVRHLAQMGIEVHVYCACSGTSDPSEGIIVHPVIPRWMKSMNIPLYWVGLLTKFKSMKRGEEFDAIVGNGFSAIPFTLRSIKCPLIIVMHQSARRVIKKVNPSLIQRLKNFGNELGIAPYFDSLLVNRSDKLIAVSEYVKESLSEDHNIDQRKIRVVYNGFNDSYIELSEKDRYDLANMISLPDESTVTLLFVGRMTDKRKGLKDLIQAFSRIPKTYNIMLILAGSGDRLVVERWIEEESMTHQVVILGKVDNDTLRKLYSYCDVYVSSSLYESFGLTIVEAMSAKMPVVARMNGGVKEIVKDEHGIAVYDNSIDSLAMALQDICTMRDALNDIGKKNRVYVLSRFSWEKSARHMIEVIKREIDARG